MRKELNHPAAKQPDRARFNNSLAARFKRVLRILRPALVLAFLLLSLSGKTLAQGGRTYMVYGDFKVDESKAGGLVPQSFDIILYSTASSRTWGRQTVTNNGRYRFPDVPEGEYDIIVEVENSEVARLHITLLRQEVRQDIALEWTARNSGKKTGAVSVVDFYERPASNKKRFEKAEEAINKKDYSQAVTVLRQVLSDDPKDYQAWTELGTVYLMQQESGEAEKAYQRAVEEKPTFLQALINLGRLRLAQKNFDGAVEILDQAVQAQPQSADANYYLGEAYLQIKKGSKAVVYLNEAIRLDPSGKADAHLRLAALYNAVGMKAKAATEYEEFLKVKPDYPDKKKLQQYITENKKP
jgi:tetratricopeptide (TPR) repeat protein